MKTARQCLNRMLSFLHSDTGSTATEYALIAAVVSIVIVGAVIGLGDTVGGMFNNTANAME